MLFWDFGDIWPIYIYIHTIYTYIHHCMGAARTGNAHGAPRKCLCSHTLQQKGMEMKKHLAQRLRTHTMSSHSSVYIDMHINPDQFYVPFI